MFANQTLAAMKPEDLAALIPSMTELPLEKGRVLSPQGQQIADVYFPNTARLRNTVTFSDGGTAEAFIMGMEGVSGLVPFLADSPSGWAVEVAVAGTAHHIPAKALRAQVAASPALLAQFIRLVNDYQTQAVHGSACAALHSVVSRAARFLIVTSERTGASDVHLTQHELALALGCQRTTVNAAAAELTQRGAIRHSRGVIKIVDRDRLISAACECYSLQRDLLARQMQMT